MSKILLERCVDLIYNSSSFDSKILDWSLFTGIIKYLGCVRDIESMSDCRRIMIELPLVMCSDLTVGSSVAINGVCLTAVSINCPIVAFDLISETLARTALSELQVGCYVHVERALRWGDEVAGHLLSGHVFGTGIIQRIMNNGYFINVSSNTFDYLFDKGFVAVDGVSLTVMEVYYETQMFRVDLIPETSRVTLIGKKKEGEKVNIEIDFMTQGVVETAKRFLKEKLLLHP